MATSRGDELFAAIGAVALILLLVAVAIAAPIARYRECRAHGFSVFYCVTK